MQLHQPRGRPSGPPNEASLAYPGWRVAAACFAMAVFCWGFGFYRHGVFPAELRKLHGWPNSLISGATTVYYLCSAVLLTFVANAMARFGPRGVVLAEFPPRDFTLIIGLSTSITQLAHSCGPVVVGLLRDLTGDYRPAMSACAALFGLAAVGILIRVPSSSS